jgi:hypothetical protein
MALTVTPTEAGYGSLIRSKIDEGFKNGTNGGVSLPGPVALTSIPSVVLDLQEIVALAIMQVMQTNTLPLPVYVKTALPSASVAGAMIYVSNDVGGAVPAFSDGTQWRRVTDRAPIS